MNGLDTLWLVYHLLPVAFFVDLFVFTFGVWFLTRRNKQAAADRSSEAAFPIRERGA